MSLYRLTSTPGKVWDVLQIDYIYDSTSDDRWQTYQEWLADGNTPDDALPLEEEEAFDLNLRQSERLGKLQKALIGQFEMLVALYQAGVAGGAWTAGDFEQELKNKVQNWMQIIDDYKNEV